MLYTGSEQYKKTKLFKYIILYNKERKGDILEYNHHLSHISMRNLLQVPNKLFTNEIRGPSRSQVSHEGVN